MDPRRRQTTTYSFPPTTDFEEGLIDALTSDIRPDHRWGDQCMIAINPIFKSTAGSSAAATGGAAFLIGGMGGVYYGYSSATAAGLVGEELIKTMLGYGFLFGQVGFCAASSSTLLLCLLSWSCFWGGSRALNAGHSALNRVGLFSCCAVSPKPSMQSMSVRRLNTDSDDEEAVTEASDTLTPMKMTNS